MGVPRVTLLYVAGCPHVALARERLEEACARARCRVVVEDLLVRDGEHALAVGFAGSPTVLIDGVDPFPTRDNTPSLACRMYQTDDGLQGAPSVAALVEVLTGPQSDC